MEKVGRQNALSKTEFHQRIRDWLENTDDTVIGSEETTYPRTGWVHVRDDCDVLVLNADTPRAAVDRYMRIVSEYGNNLRWERAESQRGNMTAVVYGPKKLRCESFYLYYVSPKQ